MADRYSASRAPRRLHRRLASLRTLEWFNIAWLGVILLWLVPTSRDTAVLGGTWQRSLAFVPVAGLLGVGGWYWHRKLQQLRDGRALDDALPVLDRLDRQVPTVLSAATVAVVLSWVTATGSTGDRAWASGLVAFAWTEYVNYFRLQLMHDTRSDLARLTRTGRLRPSWLASDLARWRAGR